VCEVLSRGGVSISEDPKADRDLLSARVSGSCKTLPPLSDIFHLPAEMFFSLRICKLETSRIFTTATRSVVRSGLHYIYFASCELYQFTVRLLSDEFRPVGVLTRL
jgi:hypothetical protein